jgi:hypothetical protein
MCQWDLHVSHIEKNKKRGEREREEKRMFLIFKKLMKKERRKICF